MNEILAWLKSKNVTAHTIAVLVASGAALVTTDTDARNFMLGLFEAHPKIGTTLLALAGIYMKYSHSSSAAGTVANAKAIVDSPDAPTAAAVEAATTK